MLFVRELTLEEEKEIPKRLRTANRTRVYVCLKTIELSNQRKTVQEITKLLSRHPNTIRSYIHKFDEGGFDELMPRWGGGSTQKLRDLDKEYFEDLLNRPPSHFEKLESQSQNWTYELLGKYLLVYEDRKVSPNTIWYHLRRIEYTSGRSKLSVTSPDPEYQIKRERVEEVEKKSFSGILTQADSRFYVFTPGVAPKPGKWIIMDETDLHLCPDLETKGLHLKGKQSIIRAPGVDEVAYLFGSSDPFAAKSLFEIYDRKRSEEFCLHLEHLTDMCPDSFLFVGCDNAPAHISRDTKLYLKDKQDSLELVYFPTYSPNLNGMEILWRFLRKQMTRDTVYETLDAECVAICNWLRTIPLDRIIQTLGRMKKVTNAI